jgi:hypothetical protein
MTEENRRKEEKRRNASTVIIGKPEGKVRFEDLGGKVKIILK